MSGNTSSTKVRSELVEALRLDLVGPSNDHGFAHELLPQSPRRWYLTGFPVPSKAEPRVKSSGDDEMAEEGPEKASSAASAQPDVIETPQGDLSGNQPGLRPCQKIT